MTIKGNGRDLLGTCSVTASTSPLQGERGVRIPQAPQIKL